MFRAPSFPPELHPLVEKVLGLTGGFLPIIEIVDDQRNLPFGYTHRPTLYPGVIVAKENCDWGKVAHGLFHSIRTLQGIPELRVYGNEQDQAMAQDINSEIEALAFAQTGHSS